MDIFTLDKDTFQSNGPVRGIEKVLWVERYSSPGEFEIVGNPVPLMTNLPIGSFISHPETDEVMVVEKHIIDESTDNDNGTKLVVTGYCLPDFIGRQRVVSFNNLLAGEGLWSFESLDQFANYPMHWSFGTVTTTVDHFVTELLTHHLKTATGNDENIDNLYILSYQVATSYQFGSYSTDKLPYLSDAVYKLLKSSDIGIKAVRPNPHRFDIENHVIDDLGGFGDVDPTVSVFFMLYMGNDLSESVTFNINDGDIHNARYYWSSENDKNAFYSANKEYALRSFEYASSPWERKVLRVDADDYIPYGLTSSEIWSNLYSKGFEQLQANNGKGLILDAIGSTNAGPKFNFDYRLGDIISIFGNYGINQKMRVTEVAISQDHERETVIPTFAPVYLIPYSPPT